MSVLQEAQDTRHQQCGDAGSQAGSLPLIARFLADMPRSFLEHKPLGQVSVSLGDFDFGTCFLELELGLIQPK